MQKINEINFNVAVLKSGIHRRILGYEQAKAAVAGDV